MRNIKNKLSFVLAILLLVTCVIGSLAYFSDRVTEQAEVSVMSNAVNIDPDPDPEIDPGYTEPTPNDPNDDLTAWWAHLNSTAKVNFNPGDKMDLSYVLKNKGALDIKVRETFIVTSSKAMTFDSSNRGKEFTLCTKYAPVSTGGIAASEYTGMTFTKLSNTQYKVTVAGSELAVSGSAAKDYYLVFAPTADNTWQKATCTVDYVVEAMQADGDWATVTTGQLTLNGQNINAVPAA